MTQNNDTDPVVPPDPDQDSSVIKMLRKELSDAKAELKAIPDRDTLVTELKSELARNSEIEALLIGFGHPAGMLDTVKGKLGEKDATKETVAEALTSTGYKVDVEGAAPDPEGAADDRLTELAKVTDLSAQVQSAASGGDSRDVEAKIAAAETPDEIAAVMEEAGLLAPS